jgi:hypothetical protein
MRAAVLMLTTARISMARSCGRSQSWSQQAKVRFSQPSATRSRMALTSGSPCTIES